MFELKNNEQFLSESQLNALSLNEKRTSYYPINTVLDFTGNVTFIKKTSSAGRDFLVFGAVKNGKESRIPASMILRQPFDPDKAKTLAQTELMRQIQNLDDNQGPALWNLIKGRKIKVINVVAVKETPFGESAERDVKYSIFDYA